MAFVKDDDVVQALPPDRPDHALDVSVLPRGAWCRDDLSDSHSRDPLAKDRTVRGVAVAQQKAGAVSHGNASITCCESHAAVGCCVTSNRTILLRP